VPKAANVRHARGLRGNRPLQAIIAGYSLLWIALAIAPKYRSDWLLENLLVFAAVGLLVGTFRRFQFSNVSYGLFALFLALHAYGAHYTYAETPFGFWLAETLDLPRNHYDRIVHFAFGLLLIYPLRELMQRVLKLRRVWAYLLPFLVILAMSSVYEQIESWVARIVNPELGSAYLGTQGDEWDAQRDMDRAMTGAAIGLGCIALAERHRSQRARRRKAAR
jgi:putative membrane protein